MNISVVIVHWNSIELLDKQLSCLDLPHSTDIIVVDNASSVSVISLQKKFPNVNFILNVVNRGFAFACNQGLRASTGKWVLFLNPDVEINANQITQMVEYATKYGYVAVSPLFKSKDYQKPLPSLRSILSEFTPLSKVISIHDFANKTLVGGCLVIQREVLESLHGWDERFFLWFEDSDLTKMLQLEHRQYGFYSNSGIGHIGGSTFLYLDDQMKKNIFFHSLNLFSQKYFDLVTSATIKRITQRFMRTKLLVPDINLKVSIVVPNLKFELLESFLNENYRYFDFKTEELILVTSSDQYESLRAKYPEAIFIYQSKNQGFAQTVNTGIRRARGLYIGTVNDDIILNESWLSPILCALTASEKIGSVSPIIKKRDGTIESIGVNVLPIGKAVVLIDIKEVVQSSAFNAAAVVFSREALEDQGLFDEHFESYLEDIDLGLRFSRNGWKNVAICSSSVIHFGQQTSTSMHAYKNWLDVRNWWLVMFKNYTYQDWLNNLVPILIERGRNIAGLLKSL